MSRQRLRQLAADALAKVVRAYCRIHGIPQLRTAVDTYDSAIAALDNSEGGAVTVTVVFDCNSDAHAAALLAGSAAHFLDGSYRLSRLRDGGAFGVCGSESLNITGVRKNGR